MTHLPRTPLWRLALTVVLVLSVTALARTPIGSAAEWAATSPAGRTLGAVVLATGRAVLPGVAFRAMTLALAPPPPPAPSVTASKAAAIQTDVDGDGRADPGDTIRYTVTVSNGAGVDDALAVHLADTPDAHTTFVPGSLHASPIAADDSYSWAGNTQLDTSLRGLPSILVNDTTITDSITLNTTPASGPSHGTVTIASNGHFVYTPNAGYTGPDSFTYTIANSANGTLTSTGTATITLTSLVWYLQAGASGDGRSNTPSSNPATMSSSAGTSDIFYVFSSGSTLNGAFTLKNSQQLLGQGVALMVNGIPLFPAGAPPAIGNTGGDAVTLGSGNTLQGFTIGTTSGTAIKGANVGALTVNSGVSIATTGAGLDLTGVSTPSVNVTLTSLTSGGGPNNAKLNGLGGTVNLGTGAISGASAAAFLVGNGAGGANTGGTAAITYGGTITTAGTARAVDIEDRPAGAGNISLGGTITHSSGNANVVFVDQVVAGTITLSGANSVLNGGTADAVHLTNNTGATINFTGGGLNIDTTNGAGFLATGGGTVNVIGSNNSINSTIGSGLNIANTTIGSSNVTFRSISSGTASNSAATGIILDTTGSSGGLRVTGDGTTTLFGNSSGGTIQHKTGSDLNRTTGVGIYLNSTFDVQLANMTLHDFDNHGIRGFAVNGFALSYSTVNGTNGTNPADNGTDDAGEGSVYFGNVTTNGLLGTVSVISSTFSGGRARNFSNTTTSGTLHLSFQTDTFGLNQDFSDANQSLLVEARNSGTIVNTIVTSCTFTGSPGDLVNFTGQQNTTMNVIFGGLGQGNALSNSHAQNIIGGGGMTLATAGTMIFDVRNNTFQDANGDAITLQMAAPQDLVTDARSLDGTIDGNTIGVSGVADSGSQTANGVFLSFADNFTDPKGLATIAITNNVIQQYHGNAGIFDDNTGGGYDLNLTVTGNTIREPGAGAFAGLAVTNGSPASSDDINVFAKISNNDVRTGDPADAGDIIVAASGTNSASHTFTLSGATASDVASLSAIQTFLQNSNDLNGAAANTVVTAYVDAPVTVSAFKASAASPPLPATPVALLGTPAGVNATNIPSMPGATTHVTVNGSQAAAAATLAFHVPDRSDSLARWRGPSIHGFPSALANIMSDGPAQTGHARYSATALAEWVSSGWQSAIATVRAVVRRLPDAWSPRLEAAGADVALDIGTLPAGKTVTVIFDVTVDNASAVQYINQATVTGSNFSAVTTNTVTTQSGTPTKLVITQINGGANPTVGTGFAVVVQSQDVASAAASVTTDTAVLLSLNTGTGTLGGTLTGTITAGSSSVTISGVTYTKAESGVRITATRTSGDVLTASTSAAFTVNAGPVTQYVLTPAATRTIVSVADRITIQPVDANGNPTVGSASVSIIGRNVADTADNLNVEVDADKNGTFGDAVVNTAAGATTFDVRNAMAQSFRVKASDGPTTGLSAVLTTYPLATAGQVVISEVRFRGPSGVNDAYINFYNSSGGDVLVGTTDGSAGWALVAADGATRFTIPNGVLLPARGAYLAVNTSGFSLGAYPAGPGGGIVGIGDLQYTVEIPSSGAGVALFRSAVTMDLANRLDAVGYTTADPLYREGAGFPTGGDEQNLNLTYAFVRDMLTGAPKDTDDNAADFKLLDASSLLVSVLGPRLGVPSPHALASPLRRSEVMVSTIPAVPSTVRDNRPYVWNIPGGGTLNFPVGVLSVPKRFLNNTGGAITRLRVRVVDLTTFPSGAGVADLRLIDATGTVTNSAGATVVAGLKPMLVEFPSIQPNGGGLNATLTLDVTGLPGGVLANGATVDVHLLLGVMQTGTFRFFIMMEGLP